MSMSLKRPSKTKKGSENASEASQIGETKRLAIDIPEAMHRELKTKAAKHGVSMKQMILMILSREGLNISA